MWNYKKPKVVAEIGCNHKGSLRIAKRMIREAQLAGATAVKFQKRYIQNYINNPAYYKHRKELEFTLAEHTALRSYCRDLNIQYGVSVFDKESVSLVTNLNPDYIKIGSGQNLDFATMGYVGKYWPKDVHISLGMITETEKEKIIDFWQPSFYRCIFYACTSGYPIDYKDACLKEILNLHFNRPDRKSAGIGYSGHHLGISIDIAAYVYGAEWIERHFTLNKNWKGSDQAMSLLPRELTELVTNLNHTYLALTYKDGRMLDIEKPIKEKYTCLIEG
jgi:N-acetylneuraminate synthase